jgi:BirA family biotin operon repressor/biotin-[acetyl-CoA-carboxylase] ligase
MAGPELPPFYKPIRLDRVGSTNEELKRLAAMGAPEGLIVVAGEQTAGRGRRERAWASPPGNLYVSVLFRPDRPMRRVIEVGFVAAVAVAETIAARLPAGADVRCKWPNDVLIGGRKTAGILLEATSEADGTALWLALGVGINVVSHPSAAETAYPSTALRAEGAGPVTAEDVLSGLAANLDDGYHRWLQDGFAPVRQAWLARAFGRGGSVDVRLDERTTVHGRFLDLDDDGALLLEDDDGRRRRITAGDVFPLPAPA